jgi:hypothetical protein
MNNPSAIDIRDACLTSRRPAPPPVRFLACAVILLICATPSAAASHSHFGANVYIFNPHMPLRQIQATADRIAKRQIDNQFGDERYALLFEPGTYGTREHPLNIQVGYYTAVAGLGASPTDVLINGSAQVRNRCLRGACVALDNFWRSLSNLTINAISRDCDAGEIWAVSQAAPMRRVRVTGGDLRLSDACTSPSYASGGFIADSQFDGQVINGTQQQFLVRNSTLKGWSGGNWNQVFSGVLGAPSPCFPATPTCGPQNLFTIFLNSSTSGGIRHVVNDRGESSTAANPDIPVSVPSYP